MYIFSIDIRSIRQIQSTKPLYTDTDIYVYIYVGGPQFGYHYAADAICYL